MLKRISIALAILALLAPYAAEAARPKKEKAKAKQEKSEEQGPMNAGTFAGLALRNIGPALTSGRIVDLAVDPTDQGTYYVASASGGVWKTSNAGTTFKPIFDSQGSYSIGCLAIDPENPLVIWVGTGE